MYYYVLTALNRFTLMLKSCHNKLARTPHTWTRFPFCFGYCFNEGTHLLYPPFYWHESANRKVQLHHSSLADMDQERTECYIRLCYSLTLVIMIVQYNVVFYARGMICVAVGIAVVINKTIFHLTTARKTKAYL